MGNPLVTPISELWHGWGFLVWEPSDGIYTREQISLAAGYGIITAGTVLGALLTGTATEVALGTNTGNGTFGAITVGTGAAQGNYVVEFDDATHFIVSSPTGVEIGHGTVGVAFSAGGIGFTITAGATAFAPADGFVITVAGTLTYAPYDPTQTNGLQNAVAILGSGRKDTTNAAQKAAGVVRGPTVVNASELVWGANVTTAAQQQAGLAGLLANGIRAR
ncbi:MAG TPA: head decoration protein [Novosphingobium sp.]|nr:head decoration protein [Novosphingobium sp.]HZV10550.1 head decoration protein [Novosphingobium sp.]